MKRFVPVVLLATAATLSAQSWRDASVRSGPQFTSYDIKAPVNEKISQMAFPFFVTVPVMPALTIDIGTAYASATHERRAPDSTGALVVVSTSKLSGLTDTQLRANYSLWQDMVVVTAGANLPTGSATIEANELDAATRIGSDFLTFPISGFGSGTSFTGGLAFAKPAGAWNLGFAASMRHAGEYTPFKDASGTETKFTPGTEIRTRFGLDHPWGEGRISLGFTVSSFGDDKANSATFNSGNRYIAQMALSNALKSGVDYNLIVWNLYRSSGTLIDSSSSPSANITNAMFILGLRGPKSIGIEPSVETRLWTQENSKTSFLTNLGVRFYVIRGNWAVVPGFGFSAGTLESATMSGWRMTLAARVGH